MKRILIIQTAFIGDVILATPVIEKLHQHFPDAEIDFLLRKGNESLLKSHPYIRKILVRDKRESKWQQLRKLVKEIRSEKYDMVLNLQRFASTGLLTVLSGAKLRIGFRKNPFSLFFTHRGQHQIGNGTHEVERNLSLITKWTDNKPQIPKLYPSQADFRAIQDLKSKPYACIAPTSVWHTKQFPAKKWLEFLHKIPNETTVYLLGGPDDQDACQTILENAQYLDIHNLAGKLSLLASAALMEDAVMNYVNDSAPMHLASARNAPVVAVFCSTLPAFGFTPLSDKSKVVQTNKKLACRPCGLHGKRQCKIGTFDCAMSINVEEMLNELAINTKKQG